MTHISVAKSPSRALFIGLLMLAMMAAFWPGSAPASHVPRLANLSTRMQVLTGDNVMIGGFIIGGSTSKTVVVRARGPSLIPFGITNALPNPTLQLVRSSDQVTLGSNDNWKSAGNAAAISASGFAPDNDAESAIMMSLAPGAYTAIVSGAGGSTGVGIIEVFEVDQPDTPLSNISTRGQVRTGNDVMIGGFVIQGSSPETVVVRARGPSLVPFGIANALADPVLQLVRSSDGALLAVNDNWQSAPNAINVSASGFAPDNALEAAIYATLPPGAYTAIVTGAGAGTGVGIVETFAAPTMAFPWPTWTPGVIAVPPSTTGITYYVDGTNGNNTKDGKSLANAFKTIAKAVSVIAAGDTVLIRGGLYREGINLTGASGTALKPITFGSYGDGEVILDGSTKVNNWTLVGGTVWQAQATFAPIGVVVNEVPLKQVRQAPGTETAAAVTSGSGKWHRSGTNLITADFGTTIGSGNPNNADIIVPKDSAAQEHVFWFGVDYVTFKGLTVRGNGSNGLWGYGSHITVENCDIKFNGKAAVSFLNDSAAGVVNSDNAVIMSHAYHNNLINWPRGNNGFAVAGGGWPGTLVWDTNLRPLARGNVVHMNGGEGIISYGTAAGKASGSAIFEQNVAYDNWSVNMYFDNQPNNIARRNFLFNHPPDSSNFVSGGVNLDKFSVCLMLADEQNSSDATNGHANLRGSKVHDNILAGCRISIRDYSEGVDAIANHGLKDTVIANNTIIMPFNTFSTDTYGFYLQDNGAKNTNTVIQNNIVYGFNNDRIIHSEVNGALTGINLNFNNYFSTATSPFSAGFNVVVPMTFAQWKAAILGSDLNSKFADPLLVDVTGFRGAGTARYDYGKAKLRGGSPSAGAGTPQASIPAVNFENAARPLPLNIGAY